MALATLISTPTTGTRQRSLGAETYRPHGVSGCGAFVQILPLARALPLIVTGITSGRICAKSTAASNTMRPKSFHCRRTLTCSGGGDGDQSAVVSRIRWIGGETWMPN